MNTTNGFCAVILVLVYSVCTYSSSIHSLNVAKVNIFTDQRNGGIMMTNKDICLLNGKGLKCERYIKGVLLELGHCLTYNERTDMLTLEKCPYFDIGGHDVMTAVYNIITSLNIKIPDNLSELNNFMCGPFNREGFLCKDCIDGFGVSYTSLDFQCSNCTNVSYGVPLYLMLEFLPATILYLIIILFTIHVTSAPMTCFVMCVHLFTVQIVSDKSDPLQLIIPMIKHRKMFKFVLGFFGIWNMNYFRYILPPFCISNRLSLRHVILLEYVSAFYPFCLTLLIWTFTKLNECGIICLGWCCALKNRCFGRSLRTLNVQNGIINCFTTFFLLSYTKFIHQSVLLLHCPAIYSLHNGEVTKKYLPSYNPTTKQCADVVNFLVAIPIYILFSIIPVMILILYPLKFFRTCLSKFRLNCLALTAFVEKFHSCYKDGSDGGKDMRSLSGLYFILRHLVFLHHFLFNEISYWYYQGYLFMIIAVLVGYLEPYKESYMNMLDTVLLTYMSVCSHMLSRIYFGLEGDQFIGMVMILPVVLGLLVSLRGFTMIYRVCKAKRLRNPNQSLSTLDNPNQPLLPRQ